MAGKRIVGAVADRAAALIERGYSGGVHLNAICFSIWDRGSCNFHHENHDARVRPLVAARVNAAAPRPTEPP